MIFNAQWTRGLVPQKQAGQSLLVLHRTISVLDGFTVHHLINQNKTCRRQIILRSLHHGIR